MQGIIIGAVFAGLCLIFGLRYFRKDAEVSTTDALAYFIFVIFSGTCVRLFLAYFFYGNFDMQSFEIAADIAERGGNVYLETNRYNYSPLWFMVIGSLKKIHSSAGFLPFHFIVRSFGTLVDIGTLLVLCLIAKHEKVSLVKTSAFFYLNPASFLLTGFHGQFENLAILAVLAGIFCYLKLKNHIIFGKFFLWFFSTLGFIIKHNIFYELIICLNFSIRRLWVRIALFALSLLLFLLSFFPYWKMAHTAIINNVFAYSSGVGYYGITSLMFFPSLRYLFILGMSIFPFFLKDEDIINRCLLGALFFLVFTTGIGIQYFILPLAFGALRPSRGFFLYTLAASLFMLGSRYNVCISPFDRLNFNIVWAAVLFWFFSLSYQFRGRAFSQCKAQDSA